MYKLLALDMDGTLLNPDKMITTETRHSIQALMQAGVKVTIASGRFPASVWLHARAAGMNFPLIALNGAVTLDAETGNIFAGSPLHRADAFQLVQAVHGAGAYVHFYGYNKLFVQELNDMNTRWPLANVVVQPDKALTKENYKDQTALIRVEPIEKSMQYFIESTDEPLYKAAVICDDRDVLKRLYVELHSWGVFQLTRTGSRRFDVNAAGISKRVALEQLCREQDIVPSEVAAAGDYDNDIEMLRWAGLGIAMGNANEQVKAIARVVTGSNSEDGVAEAIHRYLLNRS
ncbi:MULTISPECIES: Cof-type HAD-IIB family hydrolase [unclassified Paenibacillus]|uniref:Cof-type HAD-IIB family hydrolase n=1 Tax=unclassified Paenibacillus TaxID=185978 RepID=UPI0024B8923E|nr:MULTISPECIES: Cof-type HAD-IIB family hydrolase [unclassified Paenibacillus]